MSKKRILYKDIKDLIEVNDVYRAVSYELEYVNQINKAIDIIVPIAAIAVFKFKIFPLAVIFVAQDFLMNRLDKFIIKRFICQFSTKKDLEYICDIGNRYYDDNPKTEILDCCKTLARERIKTIKDLEKAKKADKPVSLSQTSSKQKTQFQKDIERFENFDSGRSNIPQKKYSKILNSLSELEEILERKPDGYTFVDTTFHVYTDEIMNLFAAYDTKDNLSKEDKAKIQELLEAFDNYIIRTINRIKTQSQMDIDVSCDVIIRNLNKTNM